MGPLLDSGSHSLRAVRNPLIRGALQQRGKKVLVESDSHNRAGPSPDWGPPRSRTGKLLKVVAGLSFVSPGLDLLVAHTTSAEKVLAHGNIVYETRSRVFPSTATLNSQNPQPNQTTTPPSDSPWTLLNCYQRSSLAAPQTAGLLGVFGQRLFVFQAAFVKFRSSHSDSFGVRHPRAD